MIDFTYLVGNKGNNIAWFNGNNSSTIVGAGISYSIFIKIT